MRTTDRSTMTRRGAVVALALALVVALPAGIAAGNGGDYADPANSPVLAPSPVSGVISGADPYYYQHVVLHAGDYLQLDLSSTTPYYPIDLALYAGMSNGPFDEVAISANDGDEENITWLVPPSGDGTYTVEIKTSEGFPEADWTLSWSAEPDLAPRLSGRDRYETSYAISRSTFATATTAVIASGADFPDALAAAGLAGVVEGPVLLTKPTSVPLGLSREIRRLGVTKLYIVGGTAAVSEAVRTELGSIGSVTSLPTRLAGRDRYETAKKVAIEVWDVSGNPTTMDHAFVVRGDNFADALAVSPFAFHAGIPVLLTKSTALSGYTSSFLGSYHVDDAIVAGGEGAVSATVFDSIGDFIDGDVSRWAGADRYATAATVAQNGVNAGFVDGWASVGLATGVSFPDALSGGAAAGMYNGPLLLTRGTSLSTAPHDAIQAHAASIDQILVFGGEAALSEQVVDSARSLIP